ncbi:MAG TPA: hypothetical protein VIU12_17130 [Chryseolinea sp.]
MIIRYFLLAAHSTLADTEFITGKHRRFSDTADVYVKMLPVRLARDRKTPPVHCSKIIQERKYWQNRPTGSFSARNPDDKPLIWTYYL